MPTLPGMNGDVFFGSVETPLPDWRNVLPEEKDDDSISEGDRAVVIGMIGFDPREKSIDPFVSSSPFRKCMTPPNDGKPGKCPKTTQDASKRGGKPVDVRDQANAIRTALNAKKQGSKLGKVTGVTETKSLKFTGEKKDKRGRRRCYQQGKLIPCRQLSQANQPQTPKVPESSPFIHQKDSTFADPYGKRGWDKLTAELMGNKELTDEQKENYSLSMKRVFRDMPEMAAFAVVMNVRTVNWRKSIEQVTRAWEQRSGRSIPDGGEILGFYDPKNWSADLDGGTENRADYWQNEEDSTVGVYAHEVTHAIDEYGKATPLGTKFSDSLEWNEAYFAEIDNEDEPLSEYATTATFEGFAEFGRLLYGSDVDKKEVEQRFPKCMAFFRQHGLWEDAKGTKSLEPKENKNSSKPILDELFTYGGVTEDGIAYDGRKEEKREEKKEKSLMWGVKSAGQPCKKGETAEKTDCVPGQKEKKPKGKAASKKERYDFVVAAHDALLKAGLEEEASQFLLRSVKPKTQEGIRAYQEALQGFSHGLQEDMKISGEAPTVPASPFKERATEKKPTKVESPSKSFTEAAKNAKPPNEHLEQLKKWALPQAIQANRTATALGKSAHDYKLVELPLDIITPSQSGEDYENDSSRYLAEHIKEFLSTGREEDYYPIVVDDTGTIIDGNHRHAARKMAGVSTIPVLVPIKKIERGTQPKVKALSSPFAYQTKAWDQAAIKEALSGIDPKLLEDDPPMRFQRKAPPTSPKAKPSPFKDPVKGPNYAQPPKMGKLVSGKGPFKLFTGQKKDSLGRKICFTRGLRTPCPDNEEKPKESPKTQKEEAKQENKPQETSENQQKQPVEPPATQERVETPKEDQNAAETNLEQKEQDNGRAGDRTGSEPTIGANEGDSGNVAKETERPADSEGSSGGENADKPASKKSGRAIPADIGRVNERIDRLKNFFRSRNQHKAAEWMEKLQSHVNEVGTKEALKSLGEEQTGEQKEVQYEGGWDTMGDFAESYLNRFGITPMYAANEFDPESPVISSRSPKQAEEANPLARAEPGTDLDFTPKDPNIANKLEEAKYLPGLETSEDLNKLMGKETTHITPEVVKKMDEVYGEGQWIIKPFGENAMSSHGIFFPQFANQIVQNAKAVMWNSGAELAKYGFKHWRNKDGKVIGIEHTNGDTYEFGTDKYIDTIQGDARHWADKAQAAARNENGAELPDGGKEFMAQPAFPVVGISNEDRAKGDVIKAGQEGRVHIITRNGKAEIVPHSTWLKKEELPVVFESEDTKAMAAAAQRAIDALPESERQGQIYAPDIVKTANGYEVVEANPANDTGSSGYLGDSPFVIDSYVSHLTGRSPAHVQFIRKLLSKHKKTTKKRS